MPKYRIMWGWERGVPASKNWKSNIERRYGNREGFMHTTVILQNGHRFYRVRAMLDTGSAISVVSERVLERLGYTEAQRTPTGWMYGIGGAVQTYTVPMHIELPNGAVVAVNVGKASLGFECLLGLDVMRKAGMVLNLAEGRVSFQKVRAA